MFASSRAMNPLPCLDGVWSLSRCPEPSGEIPCDGVVSRISSILVPVEERRLITSDRSEVVRKLFQRNDIDIPSISTLAVAPPDVCDELRLRRDC